MPPLNMGLAVGGGCERVLANRSVACWVLDIRLDDLVAGDMK